MTENSDDKRFTARLDNQSKGSNLSHNELSDAGTRAIDQFSLPDGKTLGDLFKASSAGKTGAQLDAHLETIAEQKEDLITMLLFRKLGLTCDQSEIDVPLQEMASKAGVEKTSLDALPTSINSAFDAVIAAKKSRQAPSRP